MINKPEITEDSKELGLYIDKDLIPYILDLKKNFTRYQIENILQLRSSYSVRIYELLKQYESIEERKINIKDLREYLGIEEEYERFYDFERSVLKVSKKEINKFTDIKINYEKIKKGRKIIAIKFTIQPVQDRNYLKYLEDNKEGILIAQGMFFCYT
ncbi:replication initiation protein [Anaerosalibacter massiliensis]|uniref:Replication initiation protein n=1 Tax=Anaerosalibacter massiliensis TaxID=1347392 RepID=A0A9X2MET5_9FIRM|nr:replication initiation protein [Anaerosalibacter massiliensis]MCR2042680.1 replication initiation protein [Anaerosalibacter massiliensis]